MNRTRSRLMLTLVVALLALQPLLHLHPIDSVHANGTSGLQCALCVDAHVETLPTGCILPRLAALPELVQSEPAGDASPAFVSSLPSRGPPAA